MPISKGKEFKERDIYVDYGFEEVMFRWDHKKEKIYCKFYGEKEHKEPTHHSSKLFNDALLSGVEITKEEYENGKERKMFNE